MILIFKAGIVLAAEDAFVYKDNGRRDPFWPLISPTGQIINYNNEVLFNDMTLEGIITGQNGENLAIINNVIVKPNDRIGLFVVESIDTTEVYLKKDQESFVLKLKKED